MDRNAVLSMDAFQEDWNASQFWYDDETATTLARQLLDGASSETRIAIVSAPSVYVAICNLLSDETRYPARPYLRLLEFDDRFAVFKDDFVNYDFQHPTRLDASLKGSFDRILCDPPFLSDACQTQAAVTVRWLAREWSQPAKQVSQHAQFRFILCTGERMETLSLRLYAGIGLQTSTFLPKHACGLSNEFQCYANFACDDWTLRNAV